MAAIELRRLVFMVGVSGVVGELGLVAVGGEDGDKPYFALAPPPRRDDLSSLIVFLLIYLDIYYIEQVWNELQSTAMEMKVDMIRSCGYQETIHTFLYNTILLGIERYLLKSSLPANHEWGLRGVALGPLSLGLQIKFGRSLNIFNTNLLIPFWCTVVGDCQKNVILLSCHLCRIQY